MLRLLVTGTDTGVGKTVVAAGLARAFRHAGRRVVAIKPVETGCADEVSADEDGAVLARAAGQAAPEAALVRLREPVTPALAADWEETSVDFEWLVHSIKWHSRDADVAIFEGAGGLLAPVTWEHNALDLARRLDAAVVLVAADRLGAINHALLTLAALEGVHVAAIVMSAPAEGDASTWTNAGSIFKHAEAIGIAGAGRACELPRVAGVEEAARHLRDLADALLREEGR